MNKYLFNLVKLDFKIWRYTYKYSKTVKFSDGKEKEIVVFEKKSNILGRTIPFLNVISISESLENSKDLEKSVLEHEYGHYKSIWLVDIVMISTILFALTDFILSLILFLLVNKFVLETFAEYYSMKALGVDKFVEIRANMLKKEKKPSLLRLMLYPSLDHIIWLYKTLNKRNS